MSPAYVCIIQWWIVLVSHLQVATGAFAVTPTRPTAPAQGPKICTYAAVICIDARSVKVEAAHCPQDVIFLRSR